MFPKANILVVDDEAIMRDMLNDLLTNAGYKVHAVASANTAMEEIKGEHFNLVISDIKLPDSGGMKILEAVKELDPYIEVIVITDYADRDMAILARNEGAYTYVVKPFNTEALKVVIGRALYQQRLCLENIKLVEELQQSNQQLAQANQGLKELDELKSEFISTASHELRTPLTSIKSCAEMLYDKLGRMPQAVQSRFLDIIVKETDRLTRLINDLLDLQRMESGKGAAPKESLDLTAVIKESIDAHSPTAENKGIKLSVNISNNLPQIMGNRDQLLEVMGNLISNAIKFTPAGGGIIASVICEQDCLRVNVTDSGIGMSAEQQARIFEKFYRVRSKSTKGTQGTGLGLNIVKQIVEKHGGSVGVTSTPGQGSTFSFTLPVGGNESP